MKKFDEKRYEEMKHLKEKKKNKLDDIGVKYNITGERVRQIIARGGSKSKYCSIHNSNYYSDLCDYCEIEMNYMKVVDKLIRKNLQIELKRLSVRDRDKKLTLQRAILISKLYDELDWNFSKIGNKLDRDRTTISYIYYDLKDSKRSQKILSI